MQALQFFLDQHALVHQAFTRGLVLAGVTDNQLRVRPGETQNSIAWLLWHATRWEDVVMSTWVGGLPQVLDEGDWLKRLNAPSRVVGTAMTSAECADLTRRLDLDALRSYWSAVEARTREIAQGLEPEQFNDVIDEGRLRRGAPDAVHENERAPWLDTLFANRTVALFLSFVNVHNTEHLIGEVLAVRSQAGFPLGL
jgi:hypothetical protein